VPFRLTPLVVKALGPNGCDGIFRRVCEETMITVRQNRESIVTLLRIIITAPAREGSAVSMLARAQSGAEMPAVKKREGMFGRVEAKVSGFDFGPEPGLPVTEQVSRLIRQATDDYNLARGFPGWFPWI
jgi:phosphatidylinositol kinase/protein kinase (PI-3  family)